MNAAETYGRHAEQHAKSAPEQWHVDTPFVDSFLHGLPRSAELLDIGSGAGNQAAYFVSQGLKTTFV